MSFISSRTAVQALLFTISGYAFYNFYNIIIPMGMDELLAQETKALRLPTRAQYVGIKVVDKLLDALNHFFWPVTNNQSSLLSLQAFQFVGQFAAIWMVILHESSRASIRGKWVSFTTVYGLALQVCTYAVTFPLWLAAYLGVYERPADYLATKPSSVDSYSIIMSIALGLIIPSFLCALPLSETFSIQDKLWYMAIWQVFPLWTGISHQLLRSLLPLLGFTDQAGSDKHVTKSANRAMYMMALILASTSRCLVLATALYTNTTKSTFEALRVGLPELPQPSRFGTIEEAVGAFLVWDDTLGSSATAIWALYELGASSTHTFFQKIRFLIFIVPVYLVAGPAGIIVISRWTADEMY